MNLDPVVMIAMTEAKTAVKNEDSLGEQLLSAMRATRNHWMCTNEDGQFRAAVAAVYVLADAQTQQRIERELRVIRSLSAAVGGVPVDFESLQMPENPIGLLKLWHSTKESR